MKNYLLGILFIVILPASYGDSDNSGCNSKKSGYSEEQSEQTQQSEDKEDKDSKRTFTTGEKMIRLVTLS